MRSNMLVGILVVAACATACSANESEKNGATGVAGGSGTPGPAGEKGAQGDRGPAGDTGPAGSAGGSGASTTTMKNGTRIKIRKTTETTADGLEVVTVGGYIDTAKANEPCTVLMASDGQLRCLPSQGPGVASNVLTYESTCTRPIVSVYGPKPTRYALAYEQVLSSGAPEFRYRVFSATPSAATQVCTKSAPSTCTCRAIQPADETVYETEVPFSEWAAITRSVSVL